MADTQRRFGLISSHLPTYPTMQAAIVIALLALAIMFLWKRSTMESAEKRLTILLVAALLALNQSVFTGFDAMFRSYYRVPFTILLWLTTGVIVLRIFGTVQGRPRTVSQRLGYGALFALSILTLAQSTLVDYRATAVNAERLEEESVTDVVAWLNAIPKREIVAAPLLFADLVPALTHHSVLLSHYARFGVVTDAELADRFLLQRSLYPAHDYPRTTVTSASSSARAQET